MSIIQRLVAKKEAEKRVPLTITIKAETMRKVEELAEQANFSVSFLVSEILDMGLAIGQTIDVVGEQMQGFADKIIAANSTLLKAEKRGVKKRVKKVFPKGFSGKRKKRSK